MRPHPVASSEEFVLGRFQLAIPPSVAADMGEAATMAMAIRNTGAMPFRFMAADHTDIRTDTTRDMGIEFIQGGIRTTTRIRRILPITIEPIEHRLTRPSALAYSVRMAGKCSVEITTRHAFRD